MNINKNTLLSVFIFLGVLNSPLLFSALTVPKGMLTNLTAVMYLLGAVVLTIINMKTKKESTMSERNMPLSKIILIGLLGIIMSWFLQIIIGMFEMIVLKQTTGSQNTQDIANMVRASPFFILAVTIAGPIMEEFIFRFSLINFLNQKLNVWWSAIISSAIFSVMHGDGHFLLYGGLGFFFFLLYKKTGSILTTIIAHAGMNTLVILLQLTMN
ncbi:CPBP family intramembrane glutamic endopeptidase [Vagococcus hydrophili]|uniref:CPBP family intramembrane metalloprotease n=1 Tax=Vagococcus hydrophili TaxID=2714947 RepID=A0A6G8ARK7_9ENTE|nr:type II CAAX endopeptidase family protein [Vagococcus hydrophili]QIL47627.1 CPBP family intramembrane metalloprotease [Vagococcus hydrophili]